MYQLIHNVSLEFEGTHLTLAAGLVSPSQSENRVSHEPFIQRNWAAPRRVEPGAAAAHLYSPELAAVTDPEQ